MAKKAFLLGRNTGSLRHCCIWNEMGELQPCDVQLMQACLQRHDYQIILAERDGKAGQILNQLSTVLQGCAQEDTFIFYFSGHSLIRQGDLYLMLADDTSEFSNLYDTMLLIKQLRTCKAGSKLLILDCCEAGQSVYKWTPANEDNFRVLTATDRTQRGKEFEELKAGVFAYHLHRALTEPELWVADETGVIDAAGIIWIDKLSKWLRAAIADYGKSKQRQVPDPVLYGPDNQNVALAEHLPHYRHTFIPTCRIDELKQLLAQTKLTPDTVQSLFDDCLRKITGCLLPPRIYDRGRLNRLLDYLLETGRQPKANVPVPLLEFVTRLADKADNESALRQWVDAVARSLDLDPVQRTALGHTRDLPAPPTGQALYLLISLAPNDRNNQYYTAQAWFVDGYQKQHGVYTQDTRHTVRKTPELLAAALAHDKVKTACDETDQPLTLEFFLPRHLLDTNLDDWTSGPEPEPGDPARRPLGTCYNAVVRALDRTLPPPQCRWSENWALYWNRCAACRDHPPGFQCTAWVTAPQGSYQTLLDQGKYLFILDFIPEQRALLECLADAIAMLLWPRRQETWTVDLKNLLQEKMAHYPLGKLPDAVREVRRQLWNDSKQQHTGHLCLLWDDPHRKPRDQERLQPLVNPLA